MVYNIYKIIKIITKLENNYRKIKHRRKSNVTTHAFTLQGPQGPKGLVTNKQCE